MALTTVPVSPLDPYLATGPSRYGDGVLLTANVVLDAPYGFASRLYVGTAGNVSYVRWDGVTQVLNNLQAGVWHKMNSLMVNSAGTTAANIVWGS